ncbi:MAG: DNA polymerase V [Gammaproteobacteria bacterium]|jgi:DNA polymerase V
MSERTIRAPLAKIAVTVVGEHSTPTNCVDSEPYALRVIGNDLAPDLPDGCVVIIDPSVAPCAKQYVVADLQSGVTLGALAGQSGQWLLHPRGTEHDGVTVRLQQIRGVVVQRAGRRRRDHKHF